MDFSGVNDIDGCAVKALERFMEVHHEAGIEFALAGMKGPVRDVVGRAGWPDLLGKRMQYVSTQQAVEDLLKNTSRGAIC